MIWGGREFALNCGSGTDPETGIRCVGDNSQNPNGLINGWVWSLSLPRYTSARREALYQKYLSYGYTHITIQVTECVPGDKGYHNLYPTSAADCAGWGTKLNTILREARAHNLITWCTGLTEKDPPAAGLDTSLCDAAMDDWDDVAEKDCHINAMAQWFPQSYHIIEMPEGAVQPNADACTPAGTLPAANGAAWIAAARKRDPLFAGVALEVSYTNGKDSNLNYIKSMKAWWGDFPQNRFEQDTYWKFWDNYKPQDAIAYNDSFAASAPWLTGWFSGATVPGFTKPVNNGPSSTANGCSPSGGGAGPTSAILANSGDMIDAGQITILGGSPGDVAGWPITATMTKIALNTTDGSFDFTKRDGPDSWPDIAIPGWNEGGAQGMLEYTVWMALNIGGRWYASGFLQQWKGRPPSFGPSAGCPGNWKFGVDWYYDPNRWSPMAGHRLTPGEQVGFFVTTGNSRAGQATVAGLRERSNIVVVPYPDETGAVYVAGNPVSPSGGGNPGGAAVSFGAGQLNMKPDSPVRSGGFWLNFQGGDGNLVVYDGGGNAVGAMTFPGNPIKKIRSFTSCTTDRCFVAFQGDGNLVGYDDNGAYFATATENQGWSTLVFDPSRGSCGGQAYLCLTGARGIWPVM